MPFTKRRSAGIRFLHGDGIQSGFAVLPAGGEGEGPARCETVETIARVHHEEAFESAGLGAVSNHVGTLLEGCCGETSPLEWVAPHRVGVRERRFPPSENGTRTKEWKPCSR